MHCRHHLLVLLLATILPSSLAAIFPRQDTTTTSSSSTSTSATSAPTTTTTASPTLTTSSSVTVTSAAAVSSSAQPIVSVISGGSLTTIEPSGSSSVPVPTGVGNSTQSNVTQADTPACVVANYALNGTFAPFCLPTNGTAWIKDTSYPITWNPGFWPGYTGNLVIAVLYTGKDGSNVITQNSSIPNIGFYRIDIQDSWLNGNEVVAAQLLIAPDEVTPTNGGAHYGPIVTIQVSANPFDTTPPAFDSKNLAVVIAVPICVVVIILFVAAICYFTRKNRRLPDGLRVPRNGGRSKRGYAEGRSRRTRTAGVEKSNDEFELSTVSGYHDEPSAVYTDEPIEHQARASHDDI